MCAALGAMVNSEQEAQQMQFPIILPMVITLVMMPYVIRQPDTPLSVIISMIPFCSPLVSLVRAVVSRFARKARPPTMRSFIAAM